MSNTRMLPRASRASLADALHDYEMQLADSPECLEYLAARGIEIDPDLPWEIGNPNRLGYIGDPHPGHEDMKGRLVIGYYLPRGGPAGAKYRCVRDHGAESCKDHSHSKYLSEPGMGQRLYFTWDEGQPAHHIGADTIAVSEGELDAVVLSQVVGIPAVAIPGVKGWQDYFRYVLEGFSRVLVFGDGDDPGRGFAEKLTALIPDSRAVPMQDGYDVTSFVLEHGVDALKERIA